jgi:hypothetical protein
MPLNPVNYTYPGAGAAGSHPYPTPLDHGMQEPFTLANPLNASQGPGMYSDNMWYQLESLTDVGIQMALLEKFRLASVYRPFVPTQVAMRGPNGNIVEEMTFKGIYAMEPNTTPVAARQIWFQGNYVDTWSKKITFDFHADKVALHRYDDQVQAYLFRGRAGLIDIARTLLGESVTVALDILARNAFLRVPRVHWIAGGVVNSGSAPDFSQIVETDVFDLTLGRNVMEAMAYADLPGAANPNGPDMALFCITTPSVVRVIKSAQTANSQWRETNLYANPSLLLRYEIGQWENTRFLQTRRNVLWNCGEYNLPGKGRFTTMLDYGPGDGGSPTPVDGIYHVGQDAAATGVRNWIQLNSVVGLAKDDIVTFHQTVTNDFGVVNGVDYREGTARVRRIVDIDPLTNSITLDKPLFHEFPALSYVTKGTHIHATVYIGGPGVVNGVADPIMMYAKEPIDDANAIFRFIWQGKFKYQPVEPDYIHVIFHSGPAPTFGIGTAP